MRYDAVKKPEYKEVVDVCNGCDICNLYKEKGIIFPCNKIIGSNRVFKKSNKNWNMEKLCVNYCRANGLEFFSGEKYRIEYNPIDKLIRIYNCWGYTIVPVWFINSNFM